MNYKIYNERKILHLLFYFLFIEQLVFFINSITLPIIGQTFLDTLFIYFVFILMILINIPSIIKIKYKLSIILLILFILVNAFIGILLYENVFSIDLLFRVVMINLLAIMLISKITDFNSMKIVLVKWSRVILILMIMGFFSHLFILETKWTTNRMTLSYLFLTPIIGVIYGLRKRFSAIWLLLVLTSVFIVLIYGSRGPIVSILFYLVISNDYSKLTRKKLFINTLMLLASIFFIIYYNRIVLYIYEFGVYLGIHSKTLLLLLQDNFFFDNGRINIYRQISDLIFKYPIFGKGMFADRFYLHGGYTHNIILEIILNFGVLLGSVILIILFRVIYRGVNRYSVNRDLVFIFISVSLVKLMFSGSYWVEKDFFILVSICLISSQYKPNNILMNINNSSILEDI